MTFLKHILGGSSNKPSMWSHTYTQDDLNQVDVILHKMMRANDIQEAVSIVLPDNTPKTLDEYRSAHDVAYQWVSLYQPFISENPNDPKSYRVFGTSDVSPMLLLKQWARMAITNYALIEYDAGIATILRISTTACQFGDDNILLSAAKISFGLAIQVIAIKEQAELLTNCSSLCEKALVDDSVIHCVQNHSGEARNLCRLFYAIPPYLASMEHVFLKQGVVGVARAKQKLKLMAIDIDKKTQTRFEMEKWVSEKVSEF